MLTESIHSLVDTGDQVLLLVGQKRSETPGVHDAVQPAWNDSGAVFEQTAHQVYQDPARRGRIRRCSTK
jgi:hypothetical protein